ncbi:hypothetical protein F2H59_23195 [Salmonella enterica]|nr:hypothetical protein [Salmonella enterica]ECW2415867.1 hypothetical protein [Salmonella enterica]
MRKISYGRKSQLSQPAHSLFSLCSGINYFQHKKEKTMNLVDAFVKKVISGPYEECKRLVRTVLIFTESSDQLSRATDRVPGLPASPGYVQ